VRASARALRFAAALAFAAGCSGDLFHDTEWPTECDGPNSQCTSSTHASSSSSSSAGGGGIGGASGAGGIGATGGSAGSSGGALVGGGGAGGAACTTCATVVDNPDVSMTTFCAGSADRYAALHDCRCGPLCSVACSSSFCMGLFTNTECQNCTSANCGLQFDSCANDN
jgi:hypothetical protein